MAIEIDGVSKFYESQTGDPIEALKLIDLDRPRGGDTHSDPKYTEYTREIRHIFEQQGVLSAH